MDEPTTHLDMASIEALIAALQHFSGTLIFISHDVYFIRQLSTHVVRVESGRLTHYSGGYQYYLDKTAAQTAPVQAAAAPAAGVRAKDKEQKRLEAGQRQARYRERRIHETTVAQLEREIQELEGRHKELAAELEKPATYEKGGRAMQLNREWQETALRLKQLGQQWEQAATKLAEVQAGADKA
jgi:ATP-binding cassette subfamily F protein 3